MSFSSPLFLFLFLPIALGLYFLARGRLRVAVALVASLLFYAWANPFDAFLILFFILLHYWLGREIERHKEAQNRTRNIVLLSAVGDLALLVFFKAFAVNGVDFLTQIGKAPLAWIFRPPLGLSYVAFQAISYLVDVRDEKCPSEKNPFTFALYLLLYPRIIAGPITAYRDLREQLARPNVNPADAAAGVRRFILGLAKKLLIADQIAAIVDPAFSLSTPDLAPASAWLVLLAYSLQLYFDFSGYTDMAIGLGQAMGFRFAENFNFPYMAKTLSDFWRRWHMSLVGWFREYVFYRLEYARRRSTFLRQQIHILVVFILTGLWHGVTWNFLVWGALHGVVLGLELTRFGRWMKSAWAPIQHAYTLFVVLIGWVFFRSPDMAYALAFLKNLFSFDPASPIPILADLPPIMYTTWLALLAGIVFCFPISRILTARVTARKRNGPAGWMPVWTAARDIAVLLLFVFTLLAAVNSTHQAYIYRQF
jgi:alginate O-acetyltransferase complex protein AlgI